MVAGVGQISADVPGGGEVGPVPVFRTAASPCTARPRRSVSPRWCGHEAAQPPSCGEAGTVELETKDIRRFAEISQSQRRPLLGPSPG